MRPRRGLGGPPPRRQRRPPAAAPARAVAGGGGGGSGSGSGGGCVRSVLRRERGQRLTGPDPVGQAFFSTFVGSSAGIWQGWQFELSDADREACSVFCPDGTMPDLAEEGVEVRRRATMCWEARGQGPGGDLCIRRREVALEGLESVAEPDTLLEHETGLVIFEDGAYSRGPLLLPRSGGPVVVEACIARGGHVRLRVSLWIDVQGREWAMRANLENWKGLSTGKAFEDFTLADLDSTEARAMNAVERAIMENDGVPSFDEMQGDWMVLDKEITVLNASNPGAIETFGTAEEHEEAWSVLTGDGHEEGLFFRGGSFLSIKWPAIELSQDLNAAYGEGLEVAVGWHTPDNTFNLIERKYDADGYLDSVDQESCIKGGWKGGSMRDRMVSTCLAMPGGAED